MSRQWLARDKVSTQERVEVFYLPDNSVLAIARADDLELRRQCAEFLSKAEGGIRPAGAHSQMIYLDVPPDAEYTKAGYDKSLLR